MTDGAEIQRVIEAWADAFRTKDVAAFLALHTPDLVSFDIVPPLRYVGHGAYRLPAEAAFGAFSGPIIMALRDLTVTVGQDIAFAHSLNHFTGTTNDGQRSDYWFRWTVCFQKINDRWLIVHDHTSLPTDFTNGQSVMDLRPA